MKLSVLVASVAACTSLAVPAMAEDFHLLVNAGPGMIFAGTSTLRSEGDHAFLWSYMMLFKDGAGGLTANPRTAIIVTRDEVDCTKRLTRHLAEQSYDAAGIPSELAVNTGTPWTEAPPESGQDIEVNIACSAAYRANDRPIRGELLAVLGSVRLTMPKPN